MSDKIDMFAQWYNNLRKRILNVSGVGNQNLVAGQLAQTFGYGRTPNASFIDVGNWAIQASAMQNLKEHIQIARRHQVGNWTGFTSSQLPDVVEGEVPLVAVMEKYNQAVTTLELERMNAGLTSLSTTGTRHTVTRTSMWGSAERLNTVYGGWTWVPSGYTPTIMCEVDAVWSDDNNARWFFNTSGGITLYLSHPNTAGQANSSWNASLGKIGPITLKALTTEGSPSRGWINNVGFYGLNTSTYTMILDGTDIDSTYDNFPNYNNTPNYGFKDDVYIYAKRTSNGVRFKIELHERNRVDYVAAGTNVLFSDLYASTYTYNPPISLPQYLTITNF